MAAVNFSIKVIDDNGYSISDARIYLYRTPLLDPWHDTQYTDSDGWANCGYDDCIGCDSVSLGIEINGDNMGEHMFYDGSTKFFTLS